jgi:outer membrane protein OmpA-like peptidoglycan-associated protein
LSGSNPQVLGATVVPFLLTGGYSYPLDSVLQGFGVRAEAGLGMLFANAESDFTGTARSQSFSGLLAGLRVHGTYAITERYTAFAGGGLDLLFESGGAVTFPFAQAGISIALPFRISPITARAAPIVIAVGEEREERGETAPQVREERVRLPERVIYFQPNLVTLVNGEEAKLDTLAAAIAEALRQDPLRQVVLEGYSASIGYPEGEMSVSRRRAEFVAAELAKRGIAEAVFIVRSAGAANPAGANTTQEGMRLNRRVELMFADGDDEGEAQMQSQTQVRAQEAEPQPQVRAQEPEIQLEPSVEVPAEMPATMEEEIAQFWIEPPQAQLEPQPQVGSEYEEEEGAIE